ncbi:hypothetical protein C4D60_Mb00t20100 [Musa balbisiana]|uniref:Uncharacterized protein n=1 Tax=Musa balbisiana TaxID=52838 RepID=A0A4S8I3X2_MUSBA|nr:hypothetical protein C4D60_Mb00t20100 [Musa balbisiana]
MGLIYGKLGCYVIDVAQHPQDAFCLEGQDIPQSTWLVTCLCRINLGFMSIGFMLPHPVDAVLYGGVLEERTSSNRFLDGMWIGAELDYPCWWSPPWDI